MRKILSIAVLAASLGAAFPAAALDHGHACKATQTNAAAPHCDTKSGMASGDQQMKMLAASDPADGAKIKAPPRALTLTFMHPVLLDTVSITGPDGKPVRASFRRPQAAIATYKIALPKLKAGAYSVIWSASGMGHKMQGDLHFTVF